MPERGNPRWTLLFTPPASGPWNMALDEALLARASSSGECTVRVYGWAQPTLSLGRNQTARGLYDLRAAADQGVAVVRRPTGGRAVLHHREVTYSVTAPTEHFGPLSTAYHRINALLLHALRHLGVDATIATPATRSLPPGAAPCFEEPAAGELTFNGRKLAGSAQWRENGAFLQHGSILVDDDQPLAASLLLAPPLPTPPAATLRDALGRAPSAREMLDALKNAVVTLEDPHASDIVLDDDLRSATERLEPRYLDDAWTWRR
jgi:lipoyl(octanoyl) transferase